MVRAGETEAVQLMRTSSGARRRAKEHTAGPTGSSAPGSVTFRATASALALALSACSEPFLCDVCTTSAVVYGVVKRPDGSSVPNAKVSITALREGCVPEGLNGAEGASDTTGSYRERVISASAPFTACVRVEVLEAGAPPTSAVAVEGAEVAFLPDYGEDQPRDSVRVDVEVPSLEP